MQDKPLTPLQCAVDRLNSLMQGRIPEKITVVSSTQDEHELVSGINKLIDYSKEILDFIQPLSSGRLEIGIPSTKNFFASPFKELHSRLMHLTWQAEQVANGNYNQRIDFMGDFSRAFNNMVESLDRSTKQLKEEIAERRKAEESLKQANAAKDRFFSIISHDLRSPFTAILGYSDLLMRDYSKFSDDERRMMISEVNKTGKSAFSLLENLLEWAANQTNRIEYRPVRLDLSISVFDVINLLNSQAERKNIKLVNEIKSGTFAQADRNMVHTVLRNLISNAIKFSNKGGFVIIFSVRAGDMIKLSVKDSGVGIMDDDIKGLFRLDSTKSSRGTEGEKGTGLGLILCRDFIEKNKGEINIESEPGMGTTVTIMLPYTK